MTSADPRGPVAPRAVTETPRWPGTEMVMPAAMVMATETPHRRAMGTAMWICVEWLHDGQADVTRLWLDAVELPSLATTANDHGGNAVPYVMPLFESVWVGWWLYQGNPTPPAYDVWMDAVALDDERVGCVR